MSAFKKGISMYFTLQNNKSPFLTKSTDIL